jgi:hypothetical protein
MAIKIKRMEIAFLFLTYDDIIHKETKDLVKPYNVYVNTKISTKLDPRYKVTSYPTEWGSKSIVDATIEMLKTAYKDGQKWFILLAYDAFPLVRSSNLESFLKYQTKSLFHLIENNETDWKTSQWWLLSRADVETIIENYEKYNEYLINHPYKIKGAWDELYFLSLLKFVNPAFVYREYKSTYVEWLSYSVQKHPVTFGKLLDNDIQNAKQSFFIRKTTPELKITPIQPKKTLYIKVYGTNTSKDYFPPDDVDLMLISMVPNPEIPSKLLNHSIHIYFSFWNYINTTILEVLDKIPTYLWSNIYVLNEDFDTVPTMYGSLVSEKTKLSGIPKHIPNPPQFHMIRNQQKMAFHYSPNKIAFLFLTIGDINQPNIWTNYFNNFKKNSDKYSIYVNPKFPELVKTEWVKNNIITDRVQNTEWGLIVRAYHNLLKEAMHDPDNQKFIFISESCIPLKSFDHLYKNMMLDDIRTSYVKFMEISKYDLNERIKTQLDYQRQKPFVKHYARMCLSRYHSNKLLNSDFTFFNKMHVGDEFFLTLIHPVPGKDYMKDFEITYDNWEDVIKKTSELTQQIKNTYDKGTSGLSENNQNTIRRKKAIRDDIGRNPITYTTITTNDIERANKKESFFWRKFTSDPLPWTPELLNILSSSQPVTPDSLSKKQPFTKSTLKTRRNQNKNRNQNRTRTNKPGISF